MYKDVKHLNLMCYDTHGSRILDVVVCILKQCSTIPDSVVWALSRLYTPRRCNKNRYFFQISRLNIVLAVPVVGT
jgi:hypothetical protein